MRRGAAAALLGLAVAACSGPVATSAPMPTPAATAAPSPSPSAAAATPIASLTGALPFSVPRAALAAARRFDLALIAAQGGGELTGTDYRAYEPILVILRLSLTDGSVPLAMPNYASLTKQIEADSAKLAGPLGRVVVRDFELLGSVLAATALTPGAIPAGSHYGNTFRPGVLLTFGAGCSVVAEDATVLAVAKGGVTLAFTHQASETSSAAVEAVLEAGSDVQVSPAPTAVDIGAFRGWIASVKRGGTLWSSADGTAHVAAPGSTVRAWVLDVNHAPLTIVADGPTAAMTALSAELDDTLGTLLAP